MQPTVEFTNLHKRYGSTVALDGVACSLDGGVTGLLGPNGAGKTTLLRILATVLAPDKGEVRLLGETPTTAAGAEAIRRQLGYMPQDPGLYPGFTVFEFVDYVAILKEIDDRRSRHDEVRRVIELVGLGEVAHKRIKSLSGGMKRRVALSQALLAEPTVLLLDEPTAGLDPEQRLRFRELVSKRSAECAVIISTHQTEDVAALCRRVIVLHEGRIRFDGTPGELAALAEGHVWLSDGAEPTARLSWLDATGRHRHIGDAPAGAELGTPTIEDAYLLLVGHQDEDVAA